MLMLGMAKRRPPVAAGGGSWTVEHTYTLNAVATGDANCGYRIIVPALSKSITKIRFTAKGYTSGNTIIDNAAVGIRSGTSDDCTGTPTEIFTGGLSGFTVSSDATITTDDTNFVASAGDQLLIALDVGAANDGFWYNASGGLMYRATATNSYNTATTSMTLGGGGEQQNTITQVEVFG